MVFWKTTTFRYLSRTFGNSEDYKFLPEYSGLSVTRSFVFDQNPNFFIGESLPVGVSLIEKFKEKAPNVVVREGWGMTELAPAGIIASVDGAHPGSCGRVCINSEAKV